MERLKGLAIWLRRYLRRAYLKKPPKRWATSAMTFNS